MIFDFISIKESQPGSKQVKFIKYKLFEFLRDELDFRFTRIKGKGYFVKRVKGIYKLADYYEIRDAFVAYVENNYNEFEFSKILSLDDFLEDYYSMRPIDNGSLIREILGEDFQLTELSYNKILDEIGYGPI